jgi:hypothetical protein
MVYDGKTLTMLGKNANAFAKAEEHRGYLTGRDR